MRGNIQAGKKKKKKKSKRSPEAFLYIVADKELFSQTLIREKQCEEHIECLPENVPNKIVNCLKEDLRPYFTVNEWICFLNILHCKEKKLYTCPVCKAFDDHTL